MLLGEASWRKQLSAGKSFLTPHCSLGYGLAIAPCADLPPGSLTRKLSGFWKSTAGLISGRQGPQGCVCSQGSINTGRRKEGRKKM